MSITEEMTMKYTLKGDVKVVVQRAVANYQKGRRGVQNAAVLVLIHAQKHGDYSQAQVLCEGVGSKQLVEWFKDFGGLKVNEETKSFDGWSGADHIAKSLTPKKGEKQGIAQATMYWEYKKENIWSGWDDLKAAKSLIAKHNAAMKRLEENPEDAAKVSSHPSLITALESAIEAIEESA